MDVAGRQRVRLWLRSERAMGQPSVPAPAQLHMGELTDETPQAAEVPDMPRNAMQMTGTRPPATRPAPAARAMTSTPSARPMPSARSGGLMPVESQKPFTAPLLSTEQKRSALAALDANEVRGCTRCRLCETRTQTVFGEGDADAKIFFIGEGPGENEDLTGRPFVGRAGQLLEKMINAMGLQREQVFIANIVKCRPPGNRVPAPDEVATCTPFLERQLEIVRPQAIVTLGLPAAKYMLQDGKLTMGRIRGQWQAWRGIPLMPTFHPSYVLRTYTEEVRAAVWSDLQQVMVQVGIPAPKKGRGG